MTLNEIIVSALGRLGRSTDTYTVDTYRDVFAAYADAAVLKIARLYMAARKDTIPLTLDGTFLLSELSHGCDRILEVRVNGRSVDFFQDVYGLGEFSLNIPEDLTNPVIHDTGVLKAASENAVVLEFVHPITDLAGQYLNCSNASMTVNGDTIYATKYVSKTQKVTVSATEHLIALNDIAYIDYSTVDVIYRFVPQNLTAGIDVPEIPEQYHPLIVHYIVACDRAGGDPYTNSTANIDFSLFNEGLKMVKPSHKYEPDHFRLKWY